MRFPARWIAVLFLFLFALPVRAQTAPPAPPLASASVSPPVSKPAAPHITFSYVHVDGPYIALTFDDGPDKKLTPELLDLLAKHHIKATFFVLGQLVKENPEIVARAAREGHQIGNHSWSHPNFLKMSDEAVRKQLRQTDDAIKEATGKRPALMRPPYGNLNTRQKNWVHDEFGYQIILWDVDPLDWKRPGPAVVCRRIVSETRPGSIVLSHDIHSGTLQAMPDTLDQLEAKGFKFVTVSELIDMAKPETPAPATVHSEASPAPSATRRRPNATAAAPTPTS